MSDEQYVDGALEGDVILDFTGLFPPRTETIEDTSTQDILEDIQNQITQLQSPDDSFAFGDERLDTHSETQAAIQEEFSEAWSTIEEDKIRIQAAQDKADQADVNAGLSLEAASEAVVSSEIQYVLSISDTTPPDSGAAWSPTSPERTPGAFIWMRTKVTRGNDEIAYSAPALITGNDGATGEGISSVTEQYAVSTSPTNINTGAVPSAVLSKNRALAPQADGTWAPLYGTGGAGTSSIVNGMRRMEWTTGASAGSKRIRATAGSTAIAVTPGETITVSIDAASSKRARLSIDLNLGGSWVAAYASSWTNVSSSTASPTRLSYSRVVNAGVDSLYAFVEIEGTTVTGDWLAAGRLQVETGSTATAYFDGDTSSTTDLVYAWEGAVNASPSVKGDRWYSSPPTLTSSQYLWTRTIFTYSDSSTSITEPVRVTGESGLSKTISLVATTQILTSPAAGGATSPTTATVTGTASNTTISAWHYSVDGASFSATVPAGVSRSGNVVTVTGSTMTAKTIAVRMSDASGVADTLTVAKVLNGTAGPPGADAYTVLLSNEAHVFAGGTTAALAATTTSTVIAYKGSTQQNATVGTITGQVTGLTTSIASNGTTAPVITLTATTSLTTKSGTLTVPVTVDGTTFTKTIAWSLSLTGATGTPGANAAVVSLTASSQALTVPSSGGATNPATSIVTGNAVNTTISAWTYSVDGGSFSSTLPTGVTRSGDVVTITGATVTARTITVKMADANGVSDTLTVARILDGSPGPAGLDAYTVLLSNEAHTFAGTTTSAVASTTTSGVSVYKGSTLQPVTSVTVTGQVTGLTTSVAGQGTTAPVVTLTATTALVAQSGQLTFTIVSDGQTFTKLMTWSVSRTGATGTNAVTATLGSDAVALPCTSAGATSSAQTLTIPFSAYQGASRVAVTCAVGALPSGITVSSNTAGTTSASGSLVLAVANASTLGGIDAGDITLTLTAAGTTYPCTYSWSKAKAGTDGTAGTSATTVDLGSDSVTIPCTSAGATSAASTITIPFSGWVGNSRVATTAAVGTLPSGITMSSNTAGTTGAAGSLVLAVANASNLGGNSTGDITITLTANSIAFPRRFSWSKAIAGATGGPGAQGVSVTSIVSYFATLPQGSSAPATPGNVATPPAPWVATEPTYAPATELWRTERIAYSNAIHSYTTPQKSSAWAAAVYIGNLNDAAIKGLVRVSSTDPGFFEGRIWWEIYPVGDPKAGQVKAIKYSASESGPWVPYMLAANDILVPGSVKAGTIDTDDLAADAGFIRSLAVNEAVVSGANLLLEPSFARGGAGWAGTGDLRTIVTVPDGPNGSTSVMRITPTSNDQSVSNYGFGPGGVTGIDVEPGAVFRCRMVLRKVSGTAGLVRLCSGQFRSGQSNQWPLATSDLNLATATAGEWVTVEGTVTMRDDRDRMSMSIHLSGAAGAVVEVSSVSVVRMASGSLIVDGAVTADHVTASESLSAKAAQFIKVNADQLVVTGGAAFTQAFIQALTSDATFTKELYTHRAVISSGDLAPDPGIDPGAWVLEQDCVIETGHSAPASGAAFRTYCATTNSRAYTRMHPCMAGEVFSLSGSAQNISASVGWWLGVYWYNSSRAYLAASAAYVGTGTSGVGQVTAPAGACYVRVCVNSQTGNGSWRVYNVKASRAVDGTVITPGAISTGHIQVGSIDVDRLNADTFEGRWIKGALIQSGPDSGSRITIANNTIKSVRVGADSEVTAFVLGGATDDQLILSNQAGSVMHGFYKNGNAFVKNQLTVGDLMVGGSNFDEALWNMPRGIVADIWINSDWHQAGSTHIGLAALFPELTAGRMYRYTFQGAFSGTVGDTVHIRFQHGEYGQTTATLSNTSQWNSTYAPICHATWSGVTYTAIRNAGGSGVLPFLVTYRNGSTSARPVSLRATSSDPCRIWVEDIGPSGDVAAGEFTLGGGTPFTGSPTVTTPAPTVSTYTKTLNAAWTRNWRGSSVQDDSTLHQGYYGGYQRRSAAGFDWSLPSGATISKVEVYLSNEHWWGSSGTVQIHSVSASRSSAPSSFPSGGSGVKNFSGVDEGKARWYDITSIWSASHNAIGLGKSEPTSTTYYGKFDDSASKVKLRITYKK